MNFLKEPWKKEINVDETLEKENEYWNMECEKLILARSTEVPHNELSKLDFDIVALQETELESGIQ